MVAGDVGARSVAETQLRRRVELAVSPAGAATARITSFPFLARLVFSGRVAHIHVAAAGVTVEGLTFDRVALDLDGVTFDRDRLLSERKVVLQTVTQGTATAEMTQEQLSARLGVPITLAPGRAQVVVGGTTLTGGVSVSDNNLRVVAAGLTVPPLRVPTLALVPCVSDVQILAGRVRLTCTVHEIPAELLGRPLDEVRF